MFDRVAKFLEDDAAKFHGQNQGTSATGGESYRGRIGTAIFFAVACVCGGAAAVYLGQTQNEPLLVVVGFALNTIAGLILLASMLGTLAACADFLKQIAERSGSTTPPTSAASGHSSPAPTAQPRALGKRDQ